MKKHLRLRGENSQRIKEPICLIETPPLARRKPLHRANVQRDFGNTSACAEKTIEARHETKFFRKHLRLRGENDVMTQAKSPRLETPPLARRKLANVLSSIETSRNTSACAEKTLVEVGPSRSSWKHLRLRGENLLRKLILACPRETPPLARRKRLTSIVPNAGFGNTSACAEKTSINRLCRLILKKHLRLRGENDGISEFHGSLEETPPLARRKPACSLIGAYPIRNTSACAEKTAISEAFYKKRWKHLRLRGENDTKRDKAPLR